MLPKLNAPTYSLELPSTGEQISFRPFLVKEQKLLMIAQESEDTDQQLDAMIKVIDTCTFGKINAISLPTFDVEYVFLKLRAKSVGEKVDLRLLCPDDGETYTTTSINLDEIELVVSDEHTNQVQLTDKIKMIMKYPQMSDTRGIDLTNMSETEVIFKILKYCIWEIHSGDEVFHRGDVSDKDIEEFIESMDVSQLEEVMKFFNTMPKIKHTVSITNPKTNVTSEVVLEGLQNFLG